MRILVLGNSNIFKRKIYFALKKFKKIEIEIASRKAVIKKYKIKKSYLSYSNALKNTDAKIVYISLINSEHYKWAAEALNQNKHVIIDKPITTNSNKTKKLIHLAKKKGLLLSEAIVFQEDLRLKKVIKKINLNKSTQIYCKFHIPKLEKNNFRNFKKYGGGCLHDMSPYATYLIYLFFKNKKYTTKITRFLNSFIINVQSKNISLKASFSFNNDYKNEIYVHNNSKIYFINYLFSPPINKSLNLEIFDNIKQKKHTIKFLKQNVFYSYFKQLFKVISKNKFNFLYEEIKKITKIKNKIS